jgi:hypothetical protein
MAKQTTPSSIPNKSLQRLTKENLGSKGTKQQPKSPDKRSKNRSVHDEAGRGNGRWVTDPKANEGLRTVKPGNNKSAGGKSSKGRRNNRTGSQSNEEKNKNPGNRKKNQQPGAKQTSNNKKAVPQRRATRANSRKKQANSI